VFDTLGWPSTIHVIEPGNDKSVRVALKLGSARTGHIEKMPPPWGAAADLYGQTAGQWRARRAALRAG
jgi:hypothetical protein